VLGAGGRISVGRRILSLVSLQALTDIRSRITNKSSLLLLSLLP